MLYPRVLLATAILNPAVVPPLLIYLVATLPAREFPLRRLKAKYGQNARAQICDCTSYRGLTPTTTGDFVFWTATTYFPKRAMAFFRQFGSDCCKEQWVHARTIQRRHLQR
jgi:hypothetical protein